MLKKVLLLSISLGTISNSISMDNVIVPSWSNLHNAVFNGNFKQTTQICEYMDTNIIDDFGWTPLHISAQIGHSTNNLAIASCLLSNNANSNLSDKIGLTPLHYAVLNNNLVLTKLLLDNGADINKKDILQRSPIDIAAERVVSLSESEKILEVLIDGGSRKLKKNWNF